MKNFKKDFEDWFYHKSDLPQCHAINSIIDFNSYSKSMQWGVMVDFFDSVGIKIIISYNHELIYWMADLIRGSFDLSAVFGMNSEGFKTRPEAREKALEKAIEIYEINE